MIRAISCSWCVGAGNGCQWRSVQSPFVADIVQPFRQLIYFSVILPWKSMLPLEISIGATVICKGSPLPG